MASAMLLIPGMDALSKLLTQWMGPAQVACLRFGLQTVFLGGVLAARGALRLPERGLRDVLALAAAGLFIGGTILFMVWAVSVLPLANAIAIFFVEPLLLTLFSALFLGERVGPRRLAAVAVGLVGALVVIRPNWAAFGWHAGLPLLAALGFAAYLATSRSLAARLGGLVLQAWSGLFAALLLGGMLLLGLVWEVPTLAVSAVPAQAWPLVIGLGLLGTAGHLLIALAFKRAEASLLAPFQYLEIISATALGYLLFGDFPDALTWTGVAIILASGLYVFHRERRLARAA